MSKLLGDIGTKYGLPNIQDLLEEIIYLFEYVFIYNYMAGLRLCLTPTIALKATRVDLQPYTSGGQ